MRIQPGSVSPSQPRCAGRSVLVVDNRNEVRDFLMSRRARIAPEEAGLQIYAGNRRVPGLRREEVALLAGVSVDYYTRLERGRLSGASGGVLDAIARALQLDEAERAHLFDLAHAQTPEGSRPPSSQQQVRDSVQRILTAMTEAPAYVRNSRLDILATNQLGHALYSELYVDPRRPPNPARFVFLDPRSTGFYVDWDKIANDTVAILRASAGANPYDRALSDLIGELSTRSEDFRSRWAAHNVRLHRTGIKRLRHPVVGHLELAFEALDLPADPGLRITSYTAAPGTASADGLRLLASWAATREAPADAERTEFTDHA